MRSVHMTRVLLLLGLLQLGATLPAAAQHILFVSPTRIELGDGKAVETVNVTNQSDISRAYVISIQDVLMTETGATVSVDHFDYSAKRMLRFVPRSFVLEPGERQTIRVMARVRPDLPEGQYHSHLQFLEDVSKRGGPDDTAPAPEKGAALSVKFTYQALIPIIVSHGNVRTETSLADARLETTSDPGYYNLLLHIRRKGNGQGRGYLDIEHLAPDGAVVTVQPRRTINVYREVDELRQTILVNLPEDAPPNGKLKVSFFESRDKGALPAKEVTLDLPE